MRIIIVIGVFVDLAMCVAAYAAYRHDYWKQRDFEEKLKSQKYKQSKIKV